MLDLTTIANEPIMLAGQPWRIRVEPLSGIHAADCSVVDPIGRNIIINSAVDSPHRPIVTAKAIETALTHGRE